MRISKATLYKFHYGSTALAVNHTIRVNKKEIEPRHFPINAWRDAKIENKEQTTR